MAWAEPWRFLAEGLYTTPCGADPPCEVEPAPARLGAATAAAGEAKPRFCEVAIEVLLPCCAPSRAAVARKRGSCPDKAFL
mmetsp:Transcript_14430/g.50731  ORF Transcript_14430/g.50731 Transcript_14430/m.50731 type:complete len:81 (-) Transcript_14430:987-1229(-)